MEEYVQITKHDDRIAVCFNVEHPAIIMIGQTMNEINELAYMNGYNWEAFFNYYLNEYYPELLEGMDADPEAGAFVAYYEANDGQEQKAEKLARVISELIEDEFKLYEIVRDQSNSIEWD